MHVPPATDIERFLTYVEVRSQRQCWWWAGPIHRPSGQPIFYLKPTGGSTNPWVYANRFAWEVVHERRPLGASEILVRREHDWDRACPGYPICPHLLCMNPDHMRIITRAERGREMVRQTKRRRER